MQSRHNPDSTSFKSCSAMIREWILTHPNEPATEMIRTLLDEIGHLHDVAESIREEAIPLRKQANGEDA